MWCLKIWRNFIFCRKKNSCGVSFFCKINGCICVVFCIVRFIVRDDKRIAVIKFINVNFVFVRKNKIILKWK